MRAKGSFANLLQELRISAGFRTHVELSDLLEVDRSTVSKWVNPERSELPGANNFETLVSLFQEKGIDDTRLAQLDSLYLEAQQERKSLPDLPGSNFGTFDLVVKQLIDSLSQWPVGSDERTDISSDVERLVVHWESYRMAQEYLKDGAPELARETLERLLESLETSGGQRELRTRTLYSLGYACRYSRDWKCAQEALDEAERLAESMGDMVLQCDILALHGDVERRRYMLNEAIGFYDQSEKVARGLPNPRLRALKRAIALRKHAAALLFEGKATRARSICQESLLLSSHAGSFEDQLKAKQHLAWADAMLGRWNSSLNLHQQVYEEMRRSNVPWWRRAKARRYYADALRMSGQLGEAEEIYREALKDLQASGNRTLSRKEEVVIRGPIRWGLAQVYRKNGDVSSARRYLEESERLNEGDIFYYALTQSELGQIAMADEQFDVAERHFKEALETFNHRGNRYYSAANLVNLAALEVQKGEFGSARELLSQLRSVVDADEDLIIHRIRTLMTLGRLHFMESGEHDENVADEYCLACRISAVDLENIQLSEEVLVDYLGLFILLAEKNEIARLQTMLEKTRAWRTKVPALTSDIAELLEGWFQEIENLVPNGS